MVKLYITNEVISLLELLRSLLTAQGLRRRWWPAQQCGIASDVPRNKA
ncbi:hypothetical protein HMPREF3192_01235 [Atopobium deltae]|uniref:Uncharacterized protein n=1 Tax=Atopobium deltae TaxID=1393034 RepID=A0A133XQP8_9ACTN|nr:hypothetical protein HMPREF3192_01235 [Atopobium deltae]